MKSKLLLLTLLFFGLCNSIFAQDILLLKNGDELKVIVSEVSLDVIKYKKFENPDGPLYLIEKEKVAMITYKNGSKDVFSEMPIVQKEEQQPIQQQKSYKVLTEKRGIVKQNGITIKKNEIRTIMSENTDALNLYNSGQSLILAGEVFSYAGLGIVLIAAVVENRNVYKDNVAAMVGVIGGVACLGTSMVVTFTGRNKIKKSVNLYNSDLKQQSSYQIGLGLNQNGVALVYKF
ncbi:MAG: hypothetical protein A2W99_04440 [Bacteroidetes bacterium GWF2_33_16]|nr:MAG: hypothetical protein A2X00_16960 [Bacteroidetes bacterium GWE2_32_14]OFY05919.1 MAG: hypothetical protein A2W99_04440 [Bacteroidetes bacterium GWF2_33_16]